MAAQKPCTSLLNHHVSSACCCQGGGRRRAFANARQRLPPRRLASLQAAGGGLGPDLPKVALVGHSKNQMSGVYNERGIFSSLRVVLILDFVYKCIDKVLEVSHPQRLHSFHHLLYSVVLHSLLSLNILFID